MLRSLGQAPVHPLAADCSRRKHSVEPGETYRLVWGTGYNTGRAFVEVEQRHKIINRLTTSGQTQQLLELPVQEKDRGGFTVHHAGAREPAAARLAPGRCAAYNKDLNAKWTRLNLKLRPGQKDTWTATVTGQNAEKAVAEMVATLYDASLETFAKHYWTQKFSIFRYDYSSANVTFHNQGRSLSKQPATVVGTAPLSRAETIVTGLSRRRSPGPFRYYPGMMRQRVMTKSRERSNAVPATMAIAESASGRLGLGCGTLPRSGRGGAR